jgi:hypothetical protein
MAIHSWPRGRSRGQPLQRGPICRLNLSCSWVTSSAEFTQFSDSTNHVVSTMINGESKQLTVNDVSSNYQMR